MGNAKFERNSPGYIELMKSNNMRDVLRKHGRKIADDAEESISPGGNEANYYVRDFTGKDRAGVRVGTIVGVDPRTGEFTSHAYWAELKHGHLKNAAGV